ncbi:MAG: transglycosylase domain-containing protein, partial [Kiritimatiellae bacterium]|nr:transglycosylase domain-containing protein [Kiritimatiellia bacterium]
MRRGWVIVAGAVVCGAMVFGLSWWLIDPHLERADEYPGGVVLRDNAGKVLRVSLGPDDADCRPYYVASKEDWIVKALVSAEDRRFFEHAGVNLPSVVRAAFQNVTSLRRVSGASTITMQATRLIHPHPRTLAWKYVEAFRAMQTERAHDKLWIISQYLNRAPFGSNLVGVEAAAQGWFGKRAKDLGIGEAALLAGMVQCPTRFRPDRHLDRALQRRAYVLGRMRALGVITPEQYEGAAASVPEIRRAPRPFAEPFFCDWAALRVARAGIVGG